MSEPLTPYEQLCLRRSRYELMRSLDVNAILPKLGLREDNRFSYAEEQKILRDLRRGRDVAVETFLDMVSQKGTETFKAFSEVLADQNPRLYLFMTDAKPESSPPTQLPVTNLSELKQGDHIKWKRLGGYEHHAIVERVDHEGEEFRVIEYGSDNNGLGFEKGVIRKYTFNGMSELYRYVYDKCIDAYHVVLRAIVRLGERKYNPFKNNCEHFATWCKTGWEWCSQIRPFVARTSIAVADAGYGGIATATGRFVAGCAAAAARNGTKFAGEVKNLFMSGGPKTVLKGVGRAIAGGGRAAGRNALKAACNAGVLGVTSLITEGCLFGYNCYKAQNTYRNAIIHAEDDQMRQRCKEERNREIAEAACESTGALVGTAAGAAIGFFIPVVGTAIGALVGSGVGRFLGKLFGRLLFR